MKGSTTSADLVVALVGSTLFWLTVAGIAIRGLRIDFAKLEDFLKTLYARTDNFTFSAAQLSRIAVRSTLRALYGSGILRPFFISLASALVLNIFIFALFYSDWSRQKQTIAETEEHAVAAVSGEYFALITTDAGRAKLYRALDLIVVQQGPSFYRYNDPEAKHIRALHDGFMALKGQALKGQTK